MESFIGYLSKEVYEDIKEMGMGENWRAVIIQDSTNTMQNCVRILPKTFYRNFSYYQDFFNHRKPFEMTSVVYRNEKNVLLMRRGSIVNTNYESLIHLEHNLATFYKFYNENNNEKCIKLPKITIISFYQDYFDISPLLRSTRDSISFIRKQSYFLKSLLKTYAFLDSCIAINANYCQENEAIKYIINIITYVSLLYNAGENIIFEDTIDMKISYILSSLIKIINNPKYCSIKGFLYLIKFDWINFSYDFSTGLVPRCEINDIFTICPFRLMISCMQYLVVANPESFEFNFNIFEEIERFIMNKAILINDNISYESGFDKILERKKLYFNQTFNKSQSIYIKYENSIVLDDHGKITSTKMYNSTDYVKYWNLFYEKYVQSNDIISS